MSGFGGAPPSLTPRRASRVWMLLLLLLPLLLCHFAVTGVEAQLLYTVGGSQYWSIPNAGFSFQDWSDQISWRSNDTLSFVYVYAQGYHNVVAFPDFASFDSCDGSQNILGRDDYTIVTLLPQPPANSYTTAYFGSTRNLDCESGMKFSVRFFTCATCVAPGSDSPGFSDDPEEKKKSKFPIAAVIVPIVLLLVVGGAIVVFCCVRNARRRAELAAGKGVIPAVPPSPPPTFSPVTVPYGYPPQNPSPAAYGMAPNPPPRTMRVEGTRIFT